MMRRSTDTAAGLPAAAAIILAADPTAVGIVRQGIPGYWLVTIGSDKLEAAAIAAGINTGLGVTPPQREAMFAGSMFGWDCPAADPATYDENGNIKPTAHDEDEEN